MHISLPRFVQYNTGSLRGTRNKHAPRITISKNRSAIPHALVCASTIYGRYGESLKNECAVRWRLCVIKKSCLPVRERARLPVPKREKESEREWIAREDLINALLTPGRTAWCFKAIGPTHLSAWNYDATAIRCYNNRHHNRWKAICYDMRYISINRDS